MKMWTVQIRDQTSCSVQSDLDLHWPHKASSVIISKERVNASLKMHDTKQGIALSWIHKICLVKQLRNPYGAT